MARPAWATTFWDPYRHGPTLKSNYLWLDFHVSNDDPRLGRGADLGWAHY